MQSIIKVSIDRNTGKIISQEIIDTVVEVEDFYRPLTEMYYKRIFGGQHSPDTSGKEAYRGVAGRNLEGHNPFSDFYIFA